MPGSPQHGAGGQQDGLTRSNRELAYIIAVINSQLNGCMRYSFVASYLNQNYTFLALYQQYQRYRDCDFVIRSFGALLLVAVVPWLYVVFVLEYPCQERNVLIGHEATTVVEKGCGALDVVRSPVSLMLGPVVLLFRCASAQVAHWAGLNGWTKRFAYVAGHKLSKLKYHQQNCIYALACGSYEAFILIMIIVCLYARSGVAAVVGKIIGDALLNVANTILATDATAIALIDGQLESWTDISDARNLLCRLRDHVSPTVTVNAEEMRALREACVPGGRLQELAIDARNNKYSWFGLRVQTMQKRDLSELHLQISRVLFVTKDGIDNIDVTRPNLDGYRALYEP